MLKLNRIFFACLLGFSLALQANDLVRPEALVPPVDQMASPKPVQRSKSKALCAKFTRAMLTKLFLNGGNPTNLLGSMQGSNQHWLTKALLYVPCMAVDSATGIGAFLADQALAEVTGEGAISLKDIASTQFFGNEKLPLGNENSFVAAKRIDSLKALPAVAEIFIPKILSSLVAEGFFKRYNRIYQDFIKNYTLHKKGLGGAAKAVGSIFKGRRLGGAAQATTIIKNPKIKNTFLRIIDPRDQTDFSCANFQKLFTASKANGLSDRLKNSPFFKADVFLGLKYLKYFTQEFVKNRIFNLSSPQAYGKMYKYSLGLFDQDWFSFLGSMGALQLLANPNTAPHANKIINVGQQDIGLVGDLVGRRNSTFLLNTNPTAGSFALNQMVRAPQKAIARFVLEKILARSLFFTLKATRKPLTFLCKKWLEKKTDFVQDLQHDIKNGIIQDCHGRRWLELDLFSNTFGYCPYILAFNKIHGLKIFKVTQVEEKIERQLCKNEEFFEDMADIFNEPTLKIPSERINVLTKWLADSITHNLAAPLVENALVATCDRNKQFFEQRKINLLSLIPTFFVAAGWISFAGLQTTIEAELKTTSEPVGRQ